MFIILEGADLAGKTVIAQRLTALARDLHIRTTMIHTTAPRPLDLSAIQEYGVDLVQEHRIKAMSRNHLVIADRYHLGELIYGPEIRGHSRLDAHQFEWLELLLDGMGVKRVRIDVPDDGRHQRYLERGDVTDIKQIIDHAGAFRSLIDPWPYRWRTITTVDLQHDTICKLLCDSMVSTAQVKHLKPHTGYTGTSHPSVLLAGDEPGGVSAAVRPVHDPSWIRPAFAPYDGSSGHYLMRALSAITPVDRVGVRFGMLNVNTGVNVRKAWDELHRPAVVALGENASKTLSDAGVRHVMISDPRYHRRFRDLRGYTLEIRNAIKKARLNRWEEV